MKLFFHSRLSRQETTITTISLLFACVITMVSTQANNGQQLQQQALKFVVPEETKIGTQVGSVSTSSIILDRVPAPESRAALRYSLQPKEELHKGLFSMGQTTGNITVAERVDREKVCAWMRDCVLHFDAIVVATSSFLEKIPVEIDITDINDNAPEFDTSFTSDSPPVFVVRIPETSPRIDTVRALLTATDADMSEPFGVQSYRLEPATSIFSLHETLTTVGTPRVDLVLQESLDREKDASYEFQLIASDGGSPPRTGSIRVRVLVQDFNDNPPVFTENFYSANFSETEGQGYEIVKVKATDDDFGKNGDVVYALSSQQPGNNPESILGKVNVDPKTGAVTLNQPLSSGVYKIYVEARDQGESQLSSQAVVRATVLDTNNNKPEVRLSAVPQAGDLAEGYVSEAEPVGAMVGYLTVEDSDSGSNGNVSCESLDSHFRLEPLGEPGSYSMVLAVKLDHETKKQHRAEVLCRDQGSPSLNASAVLVVKVFDENDNIPVFTKSLYSEKVFENNIIGETVVVVTALDADNGGEDKVQYRLLNAGGIFTISSDTGVVKAAIRFDRETKDHYEFGVLAYDAEDHTMNATASVKIEVRDKNDEAPVFGRPQYKFHLYENRDPDSFVGNITVSDPDLGQGGKITLSIKFDDGQSEESSAGFAASNTVGGETKSPFTITDDGMIFSSTMFDRELKSSYTFHIVATDKGNRPLSSSVEVVVDILDMNDQRPSFSFPGAQNFSAVANIPIRRDQALLRVEVDDNDIGNNGIVSYSIVATNASSGLFRIGEFTGEIVASRDLERTDLGTFFITVNATDQGYPALWDNRTLYLIIQAGAAGSSGDVIADQNVLIVVCIICFTVIVSGGVFIALCVLRRLDRQRKLQYATSCCPGNRSNNNDAGNMVDSGNQQYDMAPPGGKDVTPKHNGVTSLYHQQQQSTQGPGNKGHTDLHGADRANGHLYPSGHQRGFGPAPTGRSVPLGAAENQRAMALRGNKRLEDHQSTSSTETAAGDSGHGSDEEFSNSLDHSTAPPPAPLTHLAASASATATPGLMNPNSSSSFTSLPNGAAPLAGSKNVGGGSSGYLSQSGLDLSYTSASSTLGAGQFHNPIAGSSMRGGKIYPTQGRGSSSSSLSASTRGGAGTQQQFPLTIMSPQRGKNSSVRFNPHVTDLCNQGGQGQTRVNDIHAPLYGRGEHSGSSSSSVSGYHTGAPPTSASSSSQQPPPRPPSRHQKHHQSLLPPPRYPTNQQQPFQQRPASLISPRHYEKQHLLLPLSTTSSSASSPIDSQDKSGLRLPNSGRHNLSHMPRLPAHPLSGIGDEAAGEESDLNTTTSGSYSVASDDVECRLNGFGEAADAYV